MHYGFALVQWTWGILQTLVGLCVWLLHRRDPHEVYHGAVVTRWQKPSSVSLGLFIFVTDAPFFAQKLKEEMTVPEMCQRLLVHEYGHAVQSLLLGPLYLPLIGIPSTIWGFCPALAARRKARQQSYFSFWTERWANALGEWATGEQSLRQSVID